METHCRLWGGHARKNKCKTINKRRNFLILRRELYVIAERTAGFLWCKNWNHSVNLQSRQARTHPDPSDRIFRDSMAVVSWGNTRKGECLCQNKGGLERPGGTEREAFFAVETFP
jgi:hypothetical protein